MKKNIIVLVFVLFIVSNLKATDKNTIHDANKISNMDEVDSSVDSIIENCIDSSEFYFQVDNLKSKQFAIAALRQSKDNNLLDYKGRSLFQLAKVNKYCNSLDTALIYFQEGLNLLDSLINCQCTSENINLPLILSSALNEMSELHADIGNFDNATYYNKQSSVINAKYDLKQRQVNSLLTLGKIFIMQNENDSAAKYWKQGLELVLTQNNSDLTGRLLNNVGVAFYHQEEWDSCAVYFRKAYALHKSIDNEVESVPSINNVGLVLLLNEEYTDALYYLKESERLSRKHTLLHSLAVSLQYQIETYMYLDSVDRVHEVFEEYGDALDDYYNQERAKKINEIEIAFEVENKNKEIELLNKDNEIKSHKVLAQRRLFLLGATLFLLAIILGFIYYRWNKIKQKNRQNELQIKSLLNEQKMLRGQMNPHFIYNSLNSIQAFISSEESYQAEKYLARFARLMRGILENSRADFVLLEKEIEVLQLYLELEQLRFENRFTFNIELDDDLEAEFLSIPPMLIQPFIENAILHGFTNRSNGTLRLSFAEHDKTVYCVIDDNGIGREEAATYRTEKKHQSLATKITEERLATLSEQMQVDARFQITDKSDEAGVSLGTKVELWIPFKED